MDNINPWYYRNEILNEADIEGYIGFVYLIENTINNKKYIGKKLFLKTRSKKVKGKARKQKVRTASDWQTYYGSNQELLEDVKKYGEQYFRRTILHLCKTKGTANYLEAKEQMARCVLEHDQYYNDWIMVKVHRSHVKIA